MSDPTEAAGPDEVDDLDAAHEPSAAEPTEPGTTPPNGTESGDGDNEEQAEILAPADTPPSEETLAVILAAGAGSRFAGADHKLETTLKRKPLLWWATANAVAAGFAEVLVIEGSVPVADLVPPEVSIVRNDDWADGQARSLQVAVHYADVFGYDRVVVGLGDQPFVPPATWRTIAATDAPIAVAEFDGQATPPVGLERSVWRLLPLDGDEGARQLLRGRPELVTRVACAGSAIDVDTAAELDQVRRHPLTKELGTWT